MTDYPVQNAMLQLSGSCNFRCRMCGHASKNHGLMSREVFDRVLKDCKTCHIHTLIFAGPWGEPTLHPMWKEFIKESIDLGFQAILSTNGSQLNADSIDFLSTSGLKSLQVSYAGHDRMSYESTYVHGKFEKARNMLVALKEAFSSAPNAPEIVINGIVLEVPPDRFVDETYAFLYACGFSDGEIQMTVPNNYGGKRQDLLDFSEKTERKPAVSLCPIFRDVVGIYWDGEVTACACLDNERKMMIGNILQESIADMRREKPFLKMLDGFMRKNLSSLEMCALCDVPHRQDSQVRILPTWMNAAGIRILEGTYGGNCRHADSLKISAGNATAALRKKCDGKRSIEFLVNVKELGDPAPGLAKDLSISWRYAEDSRMTRYDLYVPAEAHGKKILIPEIKGDAK